MKKGLSILVVVFLLFSCAGEEYFGYSSAGNILQIELKGQSGSSMIFQENDSIYIEVSNGLNLANVELSTIELSSFSKSNVVMGDSIDFTAGHSTIEVTSEDGTVTIWKIDIYEAGTEPQLQNSNFDVWYKSSAGYMEIGESATNTIWGSSNPGVEFGGMDANVIREAIDGDNSAIKMITRYSSLAAIVKKPIAAGSAFTGVFNVDDIDINDPEAAIDFGTPFTAMPTSFSLTYNYTPGERNIDKDSKPLAYSDSCDIYTILERRDGDSVSRVATAWFRTNSSSGMNKEITLEFLYGELPAGTPAYMLPKNGQGYSTVGTKPTHINVVFASSAHGNNFQGAENSALIVDDYVLNYNE